MLVGLAALGATGFWWTYRTIPPLDGRTPVSGLDAPVQVRFDRFAIPHIYAGSEGDAWQAVGYLQARDRLWQMELYRRAASGRLSELLGEATVPIDRRFLTLGLRRAAETEWQRTTPAVRTAFTRYAAGVNAAMSVGRGRLPLELQLLRVLPEPWTPVDSLAIGKLFAWRLGENHSAELLRYALSQSLGPRAEELLPGPPDWAPTIVDRPSSIVDRRSSPSALARQHSVPPRSATVNVPLSMSEPRRLLDDGRWTVDAGRSTLAAGRSTLDDRRPTMDDGRWTIDDGRRPMAYPKGLEWLSSDSRAMSNSWVLSGSRTASGRPLLANDPHLEIEMPSVWWEVHASSPTLNVTGVTIPGIPFVVIGHNDRIGWGLTNVGADVQDFFVEQLDPSRQRYRAGDAWVPLEASRHEIRVSGRDDPITFDVRSTRHGPVLNADMWQEPRLGVDSGSDQLDGTVLALKWAVAEGESAAAFDALAHAKNWTEFVDAVRKFSAPAQNFVYADVDGNTGYAMSGMLPIRSGADGATPMPGWSAGADWRGTIPAAQLPAVLNPPSGQIVTANNEVDRRLTYSITRDWVAPFRADRIIDLLADSRGLDVEAMVRVQTDITSVSADRILIAVGSAREKAGPNDRAAIAALEQLRSWDRTVDERPSSLLYEAFEEALWRRTFADEMSPDLYDRFYRYAANERFAGLHAVIDDANSAWFDDRATPGLRETREDVALAAAADAMSSLRARFGEPSGWRWDQIHAVTFSHTLSGGGRLLDWFFSRGPVPVRGDGTTVNKTTTNLRRPYETSEAASYRQILDVGSWDLSIAVNTTGQSGHAQSPHYFDQNTLWRQGRYHPMPFTRTAVEGATISLLELVPTGQ